ncbi:ATP-binding protein [Chloroflexota bacterium]
MWQVVGQDKIISLLRLSLEKNTVAHAYLFAGPAHVGKMTLALNLAQALNCGASEYPCGECLSCQKIASGKHSDVQIIGLNGNADSAGGRPQREISIEQIRELQHSVILPPFEGKYKVFIIDGAEYLSGEAANCLLKTLEEPQEKIIFILLTASENLLPETVISRCQRLELAPPAIKDVENALNSRWGIDPQKAHLLVRLAQKRPGWAISAYQEEGLLQQRDERLQRLISITSDNQNENFTYAAELAAQFNKNREMVQEILALWLNWWRDILLVKIGCTESITNIDFIGQLTEITSEYETNQIKTFIRSMQTAGEQLRQNANPQLVLEVLMLSIPNKRRVLK